MVYDKVRQGEMSVSDSLVCLSCYRLKEGRSTGSADCKHFSLLAPFLKQRYNQILGIECLPDSGVRTSLSLVRCLLSKYREGGLSYALWVIQIPLPGDSSIWLVEQGH